MTEQEQDELLSRELNEGEMQVLRYVLWLANQAGGGLKSGRPIDGLQVSLLMWKNEQDTGESWLSES